MNFEYDFAVIGGDLRLAYIAKLLSLKEYKVVTYAVDLVSECNCMNSLDDTVSSAESIIAPIPFSCNKKDICANIYKKDLTIKNLERLLTHNHTLFAGCIPDYIREYGYQLNIKMYDFMENNQLSLFNTIATAEGAIAESIRNSTINLHESKCLVIGYGKCGRTLADKLKFLCRSVSVYEKDPQVQFTAFTLGHSILSYESFIDSLDTYDYIFNTAPGIVLDDEKLMLVNKNIVIIDIASEPGGIDYIAAEKLKINAHLCLGLPGKYAPKASAESLIQYIFSVKYVNKRKR